MAKLTVKHVGPIREAEFEVKKHTVFIGPQGSGKSTLAKLIAICSDSDLLPNPLSTPESLPSKYNVDGYFSDDSRSEYTTTNYALKYKSEFKLFLSDEKNVLLAKQLAEVSSHQIPDFNSFKESIRRKNVRMRVGESVFSIDSIIYNFYSTFFKNYVFENTGLYIPAERTLTAVLSNAIWSLVYSDVSLPKAITLFGRQFEEARNTLNQLNIPFLKVKYERRNGQDFIEYKPGQLINLSQSASGYQSIIPLLLVVEYQRQQSQRRFIIEEPELNLYPTAQKDLIYALMGGLQPDVNYQHAEWVITTHSPYVLSSLNTLMLAYKVAQQSDDLRAEVEKTIPARCWINPDEFAAYYVDKGIVESITNPATGLINDSRLDDVSEDFAGEQDVLFDLFRTARIHD